MTLILLPFSFLLIFLSLGIIDRGNGNPSTKFLQAVLLFSLMVAASTEILSLFDFFRFTGLIFFWIFFDLMLLLLIAGKFKLLKKKFPCFVFLNKIRNAGNNSKRLFYIIVILLGALFFQGLFYPPNNWDSMTYHMARIVHWIQNNNVNYYPTNSIRQLYQPPFAEFFISQVCILSKNDLWANFVQLFFLISTLFAVAGIARELGLSVSQQMVALLLVVTIPEVILQSSNTQNDVVVSFFISAAVYYSIICYKQGSAVQYLFLAMSTGLAILTKATSYIYLAPVLLVFGIAVLSRKAKKRQWDFIYKYFLFLFVVLMINGSFFYRNYTLAGNLFGTPQAEARFYTNDDHKPSAVVSNITRNIALHYGVPVFSTIAENIVKQVHRWMGEETNNPGTTWDYTREFKINPYGTHEDWGANILQVSLALAIFFAFLLFPRKVRKDILGYFLLIVSMFLLFCFYLKWQPWHSRLHTPLFILITPVMAYFISVFLTKKIFVIVLFLITVYAFMVLTFNYSRPLCPIPPFTAAIKPTDGRFEKYFVNNTTGCSDYKAISEYLKSNGFKNTGLKMSNDDWEYPLFCNVFSRPVRAVHIDVKNISRKIHQPHPDVECIVSSEKRDELVYNGMMYHNVTPGNSVLFLYKRDPGP